MIYGDMRGVERNVMRHCAFWAKSFGHSLVVSREAWRRVSAMGSLTLVREVPRKASWAGSAMAWTNIKTGILNGERGGKTHSMRQKLKGN